LPDAICGTLPLYSETTIEVRIPAPLLRFGIDQDQLQRRLTEWLVLPLFSEALAQTFRYASRNSSRRIPACTKIVRNVKPFSRA